MMLGMSRNYDFFPKEVFLKSKKWSTFASFALIWRNFLLISQNSVALWHCTVALCPTNLSQKFRENNFFTKEIDLTKKNLHDSKCLVFPHCGLCSRVGLIWSTLKYQFWSRTSERTMSEDSKNVFEISPKNFMSQRFM